MVKPKEIMNFETLDRAYYKKQEHESPKWNQETDYWNLHTIIEEAKLIGTFSEKKIRPRQVLSILAYKDHLIIIL